MKELAEKTELYKIEVVIDKVLEDRKYTLPRT